MNSRRWLGDHGAAAVLTAVMVIGVVQGLVAARWLESADILWAAGLGAALAGLLAGRFVRRATAAVAIAIVTGTLFATQYAGGVLPPALPALRELLAGGQWIGTEAVRLAIEVTRQECKLPAVPPPLLPEWQAAWERLLLYVWNLHAEWPPQFGPHHLSMGQVLLASLLGILVWVVTTLAVWVIAQHRSVWGALLPVLGLIAASAYFTAQGWHALILSTTAGLLLVGEASQRRLRDRRGDDALPYGLTLNRWLWMSAITGIIALVMLTAVGITDPTTSRWIDDTFFPKQLVVVNDRAGTRPGGSDAMPVALPNEHLLGSGPELSKHTAMLVRTPGVGPAGLYWRASSYDQYTGRGWIANITLDPSPDAGPLWPPSAEPPPHFVLLRQTFRLEGTTYQVYAAGRPVRLSQAAAGLWLSPQRIDLVMVQTITRQSGYEVLSWVPIATPDDLRRASTRYPGWVKDGYLALPKELPQPVTTLARQITAGAPTPYDKALALQDYLRTYTYTLNLAAPPADRDVVDYFLFDLKRGYCDYFASAMVVMARSVGLPARLVVGYATGQFDPDSETYRVSMADAHSWVEIYFPEYGWIPFEPTPARPTITHSPANDWVAGAQIAREQNIEAVEALGSSSPGTIPIIWIRVAVAIGATGAVGGVIVLMTVRRRRRRRGTPEQIVDALYRDLLVSGRRLGVPLSETQTPHEFLHSLLAEIAGRVRRAPQRTGDWGARSAYVSGETDRLITLYTDMSYSPHHPTRESVEKVLDAWPHVNRALWAFWVIGLLPPSRFWK